MQPDEKVITKQDFAEARAMDEQRLKAVMNARIKIQNGPGASDSENKELLAKGHSPKSLCIMEVTAYILGYENITDKPPCTSAAIRDLMVDINDSIDSDRKRAGLKELIPHIINTAPTQWVKKNTHRRDFTTSKVIYENKLITKATDPDYERAERERREILEEFRLSQPDELNEWEKIPMPKIVELVKKMAAVAKFDKANAVADVTPPVEDSDQGSD